MAANRRVRAKTLLRMVGACDKTVLELDKGAEVLRRWLHPVEVENLRTLGTGLCAVVGMLGELQRRNRGGKARRPVYVVTGVGGVVVAEGREPKEAEDGDVGRGGG